MRILIVEDDAALRRYVRAAAEEGGSALTKLRASMMPPHT